VKRLLTVLLLVPCLVFVATAVSIAADRPNLLLIITDQQHAGMMSCTGNRWLETPAVDELARAGVRFERAYATNPVCMPSRFSMFSGFYPSSIGMRHNGSKVTEVVQQMPERAMGWLLRRAGYETVYGGKVHLPGPMGDITRCGFDRLTGDQRDGLADACVEFLGRQHDKPFLLVASFINPHDICYMAIRAHNAQSGLGRATPAPLRSSFPRVSRSKISTPDIVRRCRRTSSRPSASRTRSAACWTCARSADTSATIGPSGTGGCTAGPTAG